MYFKKLDLDWKKYVKTHDKIFASRRVERDLKGDCSKLKEKTGWNPKYTFESMIDEMIEYWMDFYEN